MEQFCYWVGHLAQSPGSRGIVSLLKEKGIRFWGVACWAAPMAYGSFQARDGIQATAATYTTAVAMPDHSVTAPGWRSNPRLTRYPSHCRDDAGSLAHCSTAGNPGIRVFKAKIPSAACPE